MFPSHWEILVIFLVVLLLFGAKRIPEMAKGMGKGIREFRSAVKDVQEEVDIAGRNDSRPNIPPASTAPPAAPPGQGAHTESVPAPAAESSGAESTQKETHS